MKSITNSIRVTTRDGQPLYVRVIGSGQPVLMLHGLGMKSSQWLPFVLPFIGQFKFYMPDFRGFGHSADILLNQPDVFENHAQDIQDVIQHFQLNHFYLVGYSLGASIALHLQHSPDYARVARYLHIDQSPCVGNRPDWHYGLFGEQQATIFTLFERLLEVIQPYDDTLLLQQLPLKTRRQAVNVLGEIFESMLGKPLIKHVYNLSAYFPPLMSKVISLSRLQDIHYYLTAYMRGQHDYRDILGRWQIPTTVMTGMQSPLYHPDGQKIVADSMQPSRVVQFHKSGHTPLLDEPLKFVRELHQFLK